MAKVVSKKEMAKKMKHHHGFRHRTAQMKYYSGDKFKKNSESDTTNNIWHYVHSNRISESPQRADFQVIMDKYNQ